MNTKRITRLLQLLQMLQSGRGRSVSGLAKACGVCERTLLRDVQSLKVAGIALTYDHDAKRYAISGGSSVPPANLTSLEAISLMALAGELGRDDRLPFYEPAYTAAQKLESNLPAPLRQELRRIAPAIKIRLNQVGRLRDKADIYERLVAAISARRVVHIEYESFTEWETIVTRLRPYQLVFNRHSWYVVGRSTLHRDVRTFNLMRIGKLKMLREQFSMPRGFDLERFLGNAWNLMPQPGHEHHVVIRFHPLVARNVSEVNWHKTQRTKLLDDGSLEFRATVSGLNEIVWWILGYGDQAEVLQPARLRQIVAQRAQNMATMYNGEKV